MFDRIAPVYDGMNRVMTAGLDRRWRREAAEAVVRPGDKVLDSCCGTGDLAIAAAEAGGKVIGIDFSKPMLERARRKAPELEWVEGDALALPFADESFDAATVGSVSATDRARWAHELRRVLRPGGRLAIRDHTPHGFLAPSTASGSTSSYQPRESLAGWSAYTPRPACVVSRTPGTGAHGRSGLARSAGGFRGGTSLHTSHMSAGRTFKTAPDQMRTQELEPYVAVAAGRGSWRNQRRAPPPAERFRPLPSRRPTLRRAGCRRGRDSSHMASLVHATDRRRRAARGSPGLVRGGPTLQSGGHLFARLAELAETGDDELSRS
jgi:ubiquinone/menaquinone biosynthesis C-methylase UbiE